MLTRIVGHRREEDRYPASGTVLTCVRRTMCWNGVHIGFDSTLYVKAGTLATAIGHVHLIGVLVVPGVVLLTDADECIYETLAYISGRVHPAWKPLL